jgi:hypothetical protein
MIGVLILKSMSTLILKVAVIFLNFPVLALCIFVAPEIGQFAEELLPSIVFLKQLVIGYYYLTAIPFYFVLFQTFRLIGFIENNLTFSHYAVRALKKIKTGSFTLCLLYVIGMPIYYLIAELDDAPGVILVGMVFVFVALVVAIFAAVLEKLLQQAILFKSENDLTV